MAVEAAIHLVEVRSAEEATAQLFLGSPSIQLDGIDFWPEELDAFSINCRIYQTSEGLKGWPSVEMFSQKIQELISIDGPRLQPDKTYCG